MLKALITRITKLAWSKQIGVFKGLLFLRVYSSILSIVNIFTSGQSIQITGCSM